MIIEFRLKNFRSFKDEAIFSMVPTTDPTRKAENTVKSGISSIPELLKVAGTYGPNASGKSNLVRAIQLMQAMIAKSAAAGPNIKLPFHPFRLRRTNLEEPTEFEITFLLDSVRYQYGFTYNRNLVVEEWLLVYKTSQPQFWFSRKLESGSDGYEYKFSTHLHGPKKVWKDATRPNSLFLSTAIQLNSEQLKPVFDWITRDIVIFGNDERMDCGSAIDTIEYIKKRGSANVREFLLAADIAIDNIDLKSVTGIVQSIEMDSVTGKPTAPTQEEREFDIPLFIHSTDDGSATFELNDESDGTQKLFSLAGPLFEILQNGRLFVIDELDRSLHVLLVRYIIELFQTDSELGRKAQLIFTTHDTSILGSELLRRDQVWFIEKDSKQASRIYPLTDFSARKHEALERGYLSGKYGALPMMSQLRWEI